MKIDFDKNIQKSLENYELPYDSNAWTELSKKLDKTMPVAKKSPFKWWILSSALAIISVSTIYFVQSNERNIVAASSTKDIKDVKQLSSNSKIEEKSTSKNTFENINSTKQLSSNTVSSSNSTVYETIKSKEITEIQPSETTTSNSITSHLDSKKIKSDDENKKSNSSSKNEHSQPLVSQNTIDFEIDNEFQYENGLPTIHLKATTFASNYEWNFEKLKIAPTSKEVEVHYFKKGIYNAKLSTTNSNGQVISETKKITVPEDYNLLAVDAFSPTENNIKTNTFIPFALTVRNVRFTMSIIDSKNGGIVYQTSDANQPWDGIDKRTSVLVNASESFIWKVTIENPEQGENSIYKGVVIRL